MSTISDIIENNLRLQNHPWTDQEIRSIPNPDLARNAYRASESLRTKYPSEESFVAYWAGQRRRYRLTVPSDATAPSEEHLRQEWDRSPALQAEFDDNFQAYAAFLRADRQGLVRIAGRK